MSSDQFFSPRTKLIAVALLVGFTVILVLFGRGILNQPGDSAFSTSKKDIEKTAAGHYGIEINGVLTPEFVKLPGGSFKMGSGSEEGSPSERPQHSVALDKFLMSRFEITNAQYEAFCKATGKTLQDPRWNESYPKNYQDNPMVSVTWQDAVDYCKWLSTVIGKEIRLPTEAEWEFAAQGSVPSRTYETASSEIIPTTKVGSHEPNQFGLYDMLGNVSEWCQDRYSVQYYTESPDKNPQGPDSGENRVLRGCSWAGRTNTCRITARSQGVPENKSNLASPTIGFRVVTRAD